MRFRHDSVIIALGDALGHSGYEDPGPAPESCANDVITVP